MIDIVIAGEETGDAESIAALYERAFGPGRFARTAYRVRESHRFQYDLSRVARLNSDGTIKGTLRFTAISIGDKSGALLLGPLAVDPASVGTGIGRAMVKDGLSRACSKNYGLVVLVGDLDYYQQLGFQRTRPGQLIFPGPVDPMRILVHECRQGVLENYSGHVTAVR
jgi:predicted N-acetyltransferase YhbS